MAGQVSRHIPVLLPEVIRALAVQPGGVYIDATVGGGGHSQAILQALGDSGVLVGLDRDAEAVARTRKRLQGSGAKVVLEKANFRDLGRVLERLKVSNADGLLFDLGVSSFQLDSGERGFSYWKDAPLDMRMDVSEKVSAYDLVNQLPVGELARIIAVFGEERWARKIAAAIITYRRVKPINTTSELASIVKDAIPAAARRTGGHPARRTFQALRIAVNHELDDLAAGLEEGARVLKPGGRMVVISFHSLEDRIVKNFFDARCRGCICPPRLPVCVCGHRPEFRLITRRPTRPLPAEVANNPRARSAVLRVAERLRSNGMED